MTDSQRFTKALDYIKFNKKISFVEIAKQLGVKDYLLTNIRRDQTQPSAELTERLCEEYPEVIQFFAADYIEKHTVVEKVEEPPIRYGQPFDILIDTQRKYISTLEKTNEYLLRENERLKKEIDMLLKVVESQK